ncbi:MAG TPA: hypothetical protein DIV80_06135 [Synergistaceae bacterium]|nr:hypothetical protein [Synergistaceae bacterium]
MTGEGKATALDVEVGHSRSAVQDQQRDGILVKAHRTVPETWPPLRGLALPFQLLLQRKRQKRGLEQGMSRSLRPQFSVSFSHTSFKKLPQHSKMNKQISREETPQGRNPIEVKTL